MKRLYKIILISVVLLLVVYYLITLIAPQIVDKQHNVIRLKGPYQVSEKAEKLYNSLDFIADLHCDALLWKRNLLKDNDFGQVDIPKMIKSNIGIQAFTIVTKSPKGQNFDKNTGSSDNITSLYFAQGRPTNSLTKRAILQSEALFEFANRSDNNFRVITNASAFKKYLKDKKNDNKITAGFLGVEGAHALDGHLENVQVLYDHGIRMMSATHFFDNKLGGSAHGVSGKGLTDFGKEVMLKMDQLKMIIDVSHCSPSLIDDIIKLTSSPIISSHTGVKGTCDNVRNLSDKHIRAIANSKGLVGIAMFKQAVCGIDAEATVKAIRYVSDLVGIDYVALGSDFDGSVVTPFDITGFPLIVEALIKDGFTDQEIEKIMGANVKEFLLQNLP